MRRRQPLANHRGTTVGEIKHRTVETNGIHMHIAESGAGPLVVLCHGFPESCYSWRHQLHALAEAGFHAIAPDMRGYGQTDRPEQLDRYTLLHLIGDVVGLLDALGTETAVIIGHDWGAPVAWYGALLRPDRVRGVIGLSVPFIPRQPVPPTSMMPQTEDAQFFQLYFQSPGVAEAEFERDVRLSIRSFLYSASGDGRDDGAMDGREIDMVPRRGGFLSRLTNPASLPHWLTEADVNFYVSEFSRTGFRGGLNWYRNMDRNWELLAPVSGVQVTVPALYIAGDRDLVLAFRGMDQVVANLSKFVPQLRRTLLFPGCGHWTQQERAQEVNQAVIEFVQRLSASIIRNAVPDPEATRGESPMGNQKIYLMAEVTVLPEFLDDVKGALKEALIPTLQEAGCEGMFETSREGDPHKLVFFEIFSSSAAHKFHLEQDYMKRLFTALEGKLTEATVMTKLNAL